MSLNNIKTILSKFIFVILFQYLISCTLKPIEELAPEYRIGDYRVADGAKDMLDEIVLSKSLTLLHLKKKDGNDKYGLDGVFLKIKNQDTTELYYQVKREINKGLTISRCKNTNNEKVYDKINEQFKDNNNEGIHPLDKLYYDESEDFSLEDGEAIAVSLSDEDAANDPRFEGNKFDSYIPRVKLYHNKLKLEDIDLKSLGDELKDKFNYDNSDNEKKKVIGIARGILELKDGELKKAGLTYPSLEKKELKDLNEDDKKKLKDCLSKADVSKEVKPVVIYDFKEKDRLFVIKVDKGMYIIKNSEVKFYERLLGIKPIDEEAKKKKKSQNNN